MTSSWVPFRRCSLSYVVSNKPSLRDLHRCAEGIASSNFDVNANHLIKWQANPYASKSEKKYPSVAVSAYLADEANPELLTVTPNKIILTPAHPHEQTNAATKRAEKIVQVTLNLSDRIDQRTGLPVVDERDSISASWFNEFTLDSIGPNSNTVGVWPHFTKSDLKASYSEVKGSDSLTGSEADAAIARLTEVLRNRLKSTVARTEYIYQNRRSSMRRPSPSLLMLDDGGLIGGGPRHPSAGYLNSGDLQDLRDGLCSCEGIFQEAEDVRGQLTAPKSTIQVWPRNEDGPRKIRPGDLSCGMV